MSLIRYEQPTLDLSITGREVSAYRAEKVRERRALFFGKDVTRIVSLEPLRFKADELDSDHVKDPDLLYALRFADAAKSIGWVDYAPGSAYAHGVYILATNTSEEDSQLIEADYSGNIDQDGRDDFMENLYRFDPNLQSNKNL